MDARDEFREFARNLDARAVLTLAQYMDARQLRALARTLEVPELWEGVDPRSELGQLRALLDAAMISAWLPNGWGRRLLMLSLVGGGLVGVLLFSGWFALMIAAASALSPRIIGRIALMMGK